MHAPQSAHESSTTAFPSWTAIESNGQADTHSPQPSHFAKSTLTGIFVYEFQKRLNVTTLILATFAIFARGQEHAWAVGVEPWLTHQLAEVPLF